MLSRKPVFLLILSMVSTLSVAQEGRKDIFAEPNNLKVLPKDISSKDLGDTMKGFAMGLGLRCESCHVGEPNTPLSTFDFESDEKLMKRKARVMIKMVQDINTQYVSDLDKIEKADRVEVRCVTCHRGQQKPKLIQDIMNEQLAQNDVATAILEYNKLREENYGSHSFDFSEYVLPMYAENLAKSGNTNAAIAFTETNIVNFPESFYSFMVLAEIQRSAGETEAAISNYQRAAELNESARPFIESKITEIRSAGLE